MSTAVITPLPDGTAVWELNGVTHDFPNWEAAVAECRALNLPHRLERFPAPSITPVVVATSPTLASQ